MVHLRIRRREPWTDSKGTVRSPYEEFVALQRSFGGPLSPHAYVPWEVGLVSDDWPQPASSKPLVMGSSLQPTHAIEVHRARASALEVPWLWNRLLQFLGLGTTPSVTILKDELWNADQEAWVHVGVWLRSGPLRQLFKDAEEAGDGAVWMATGPQHLAELVRLWWPSAAGYLAILIGRNQADVQHLLGHGAGPGPSLTANLRTLALTSADFHNAGFAILSIPDEYQRQLDVLQKHGWVDGTPVEDLPQDS